MRPVYMTLFKCCIYVQFKYPFHLSLGVAFAFTRSRYTMVSAGNNFWCLKGFMYELQWFFLLKWMFVYLWVIVNKWDNCCSHIVESICFIWIRMYEHCTRSLWIARSIYWFSLKWCCCELFVYPFVVLFCSSSVNWCRNPPVCWLTTGNIMFWFCPRLFWMGPSQMSRCTLYGRMLQW